MANPFFSGRIPPGLADKIDAHLLQTGETRSELLIRLLRAEVSDNNPDNTVDNTIDNTIDNKVFDLIARVEKLEQLVNHKTDNRIDKGSDNAIDNTSDNNLVEESDNTHVITSDNIVDNKSSQSSDEDWVDLSTIAARLEILPKSISGAASKRGQDIGDNTIKFEMAGHTIHKRGSGVKASYRSSIRPEPIVPL
jgi:hypothetical protein